MTVVKSCASRQASWPARLPILVSADDRSRVPAPVDVPLFEREPDHVLIVNLGHVYHHALFAPLLSSMAESWTDASISVLLGPEQLDLYAHCLFPLRTTVVDRDRALREADYLDELLDGLQQTRWSLAITPNLLQDPLEALFMLGSAAAWRISMRPLTLGPHEPTNAQLSAAFTHVLPRGEHPRLDRVGVEGLHRSLGLSAPLGDDRTWAIVPTATERDHRRQSERATLAVWLAPGVEPHIAALGDALSELSADVFHSFLFGTDACTAMAETLVSRLPDRVTNLVGGCSAVDLASIAGGCDRMICFSADGLGWARALRIPYVLAGGADVAFQTLGDPLVHVACADDQRALLAPDLEGRGPSSPAVELIPQALEILAADPSFAGLLLRESCTALNDASCSLNASMLGPVIVARRSKPPASVLRSSYGLELDPGSSYVLFTAGDREDVPMTVALRNDLATFCRRHDKTPVFTCLSRPWWMTSVERTCPGAMWMPSVGVARDTALVETPNRFWAAVYFEEDAAHDGRHQASGAAADDRDAIDRLSDQMPTATARRHIVYTPQKAGPARRGWCHDANVRWAFSPRRLLAHLEELAGHRTGYRFVPAFSRTVSDDGRIETISCPNCGQQPFRPIRGKGISQCLACGFVYVRQRLTAAAMQQRYEEAYGGKHAGTWSSGTATPRSRQAVDEDPALVGMQFRNFFDRAIALRGKEPADCRFVDIGCGWGATLHHARSRGMEAVGFDFNPHNIAFCRDELGIVIRPEQFSEADVAPESLDIVLMSHSLEHTPYPMEYLDKIHYCLKPGGVFVCSVPNFASLCSLEQGDNWFWLDTNDHYFQFTPRVLYESFVEAGFQVRELSTSSGNLYEGKQPKEYLAEIYPWVEEPNLAGLMHLYEGLGLGEHLSITATKTVEAGAPLGGGAPMVSCPEHA